MASPILIAVLVVFLAVMLAIGWWAGRDSGDVAGYYVAGKNLPAWVIAFSSNATGESAWLLLGLTGMGYLVGIHAFWVVLGEVLGVTLAWIWIARPFKEYTDRFDSITVPDFLERRFADRRHLLRWISAIIIFSMVALYLAAQFTASGKAGRALFPGLADSETILPTMAAELFPTLLTAVFLVVVLSAILSTADSLLILASSAVVRDVVQQIFRPDLPERRVSQLGKLTTVVVGAAACAVALGEVRLIFWFVLFAWSGLAAAFVPVVLCALFWKRTTLAGAVWGMVTGFVVTVAWVLLFKEHVYDLYEMIPGVVAGLIATISVSLLTAPPPGAEAEWEAVRRQVGHPFRRGAAPPRPRAEMPVPVASGSPTN